MHQIHVSTVNGDSVQALLDQHRTKQIDEVNKVRKKTKTAVDYSMGTPTAHCGDCINYQAGICKLVSGNIDPRFWCDLFERMVTEKAMQGFSALVGAMNSLSKAGRKHSAADLVHMQSAHDHMAALAKGMHCGGDTVMNAAQIRKRGAKHSGATMDLIKVVHDTLCTMGAACPDTGDGEMYDESAKTDGEG